MNKKLIVIIILVILIIGIAVGAYFIMSSRDNKSQVNPCASYTDQSSNISRQCILYMWKNIAGCISTPTSDQLAYYEQITKPVGSPAVTINRVSVAAGARTLGSMTGDAKLWASLSTMNHREGCYGTDMSKWPKNLLKNDAEYIAYTNKVKDWVYTNVKAIGTFVKINPGVLDTERGGIIMGNYPNEFSAGDNSQLNIEIHTNRKPRLFINGGAIDWRVNDPIPLNTWAHIAFVLKDDRIEYYRDGVLKETRTGAPPVLARISAVKIGYDNRENSLSSVPNKLQVSNLLISQGGNSMAWSSSFINNLFTNYKPT